MQKKILLLVIISLNFLLLSNCSKKADTNEDEAIKIPIETVIVGRKTVTQEVQYTGDVKAEQEVKVFSKIPDRILSFEKDEGDFVRKGEIIAKIEATKIEQAVIQAKAAAVSAKAQLVNLKSEYQRAQRLIKENAMSQQQFDGVKTQYEATQALVEQAVAAQVQAESQLSDANVTAPISGVIGNRYYEQGDMAAGPFPLVTVVQMNKVKVEVNAPEQDFGQLNVGQCANLHVLSYPNETFTGEINKISPVLDPITRMGKIEILVNNEDKRLKPGMFAEVQICVNTMENVLTVPKHAVIENTELKRINGMDMAVVYSHVFVENNGIAYLRDIKISYTNGVVAVVSSGIEQDENLIIVGQQSLKDSAKVKVMNEGVNIK
ncbi:efflux RND transporter periplasmic adaptor subunit [candidate division KSB1 bacterium]|nr:efflux RND transporter periplasmic adaptor subunit [candidate division KSB1 bacterium]